MKRHFHGVSWSWKLDQKNTHLFIYIGESYWYSFPGFGMYVWAAPCVQYTSGIFFSLYNIKQIPTSLKSKWWYNNFSSRWETANTLPKLNQQFMLQWIVLGLMRQRSKTLSRQILSKILKQATTAVMTKYVQNLKRKQTWQQYFVAYEEYINEAKTTILVLLLEKASNPFHSFLHILWTCFPILN